ncbi:hypothetical protein BDK51DRAFT_43432 [Blyttiomyces helicus]|uniref:Uncharacterized protein n=1 Tax=Blyttiomyces helicus TaxID=388810 RepID=A0A4P9WTL6_9FUNG|nr:hypothetical protein BDK51DRAFT_43432 [Blyttiomyces helicus]|eukprot:RKO94416.1 hypothetical protein BDK51DRAFT_43432 [Blyttiomyces helicus]
MAQYHQKRHRPPPPTPLAFSINRGDGVAIYDNHLTALGHTGGTSPERLEQPHNCPP